LTKEKGKERKKNIVARKKKKVWAAQGVVIIEIDKRLKRDRESVRTRRGQDSPFERYIYI
jgi:hypothetical protein